jgi:hypothetical protein
MHQSFDRLAVVSRAKSGNQSEEHSQKRRFAFTARRLSLAIRTLSQHIYSGDYAVLAIRITFNAMVASRT